MDTSNITEEDAETARAVGSLPSIVLMEHLRKSMDAYDDTTLHVEVSYDEDEGIRARAWFDGIGPIRPTVAWSGGIGEAIASSLILLAQAVRVQEEQDRDERDARSAT